MDQVKKIDVSFRSVADGIKLNGTLFTPKNLKKSPILFLAGSGKVDRFETVAGEHTYSGKQEQLFKQISDSLIENGFQTFLYDKRGVLNSRGEVDIKIWKTANRENLILDALTAAKYLLKESGAKAKDLLIIGHSEGSIIATEVALMLGGKICGLFLLGAQARSMKQMLYYQIVESRIKSSSGIDKQEDPIREYDKALKMINETSEKLAPDGKPISWYRQHLSAPANHLRLKDVEAKVIILQGEIDPQTPKEELALFKASISPHSIKTYKKLGHGFSPDKDGKPTLGPIDNQVLKDIVSLALEISSDL